MGAQYLGGISSVLRPFWIDPSVFKDVCSAAGSSLSNFDSFLDIYVGTEFKNETPLTLFARSNLLYGTNSKHINYHTDKLDNIFHSCLFGPFYLCQFNYYKLESVFWQFDEPCR